jgi:hypothetical protein
MNADEDGDPRMVELVTVLAAAGEVLTDLVKRLASATADEMQALEAEAKAQIKRMVARCSDAAPLDDLPPGAEEQALAELVRLGETLQAHIGGVVKLRWAQLGGPVASLTRH